MIDLEPRLDGLGGIIFPLDQLTAALVAHALLLGGHSYHVVAGPAGFADTAAAHPLHDGLVRDLNRDHVVKCDPGLFQGRGLGDGAGHPVQDIAVLAVILCQPLRDDADDDVVRHQLAGVHIGLGLQAGGRAVLDSRPEDVACGNGGNAQFSAQDFCLCSLTGAGGAQQDQLQLKRLLSYSRKPLY